MIPFSYANEWWERWAWPQNTDAVVQSHLCKSNPGIKSSKAPISCWHSAESKRGGEGSCPYYRCGWINQYFSCLVLDGEDVLTKSAQNLPTQDSPDKLVLRWLLYSLISPKKERKVISWWKLSASESLSACLLQGSDKERHGWQPLRLQCWPIHCSSYPFSSWVSTTFVTWMQEGNTSFSTLQSCWSM